MSSPSNVLLKKAKEWCCDPDSLAFAEKLDQHDKLANFRDKFIIPKKVDLPYIDQSLITNLEEESIYLCGHSLGLQPKKASSYVQQVLENWGKRGAHSHTHGFLPAAYCDLPPKEPMARLVGAKPEEIAVMNGLSVNLHILLTSFYKPTPDRHKIVIEEYAFPSDMYAVKSQISLHKYSVDESLITVHPREGENLLKQEDILSVIEDHGESIALILLPGIQYYTGQLIDTENLVRAGHQKGCLVAVDLAHAVGNVRLELHRWGVDFAMWCTYKVRLLVVLPLISMLLDYVHKKYSYIQILNTGIFFVLNDIGEQRNKYQLGVPGLHEEKPATSTTAVVSKEQMSCKNTKASGNIMKTELRPNDANQEFDPCDGADMFKLSNPPPLLSATLMASLEIFEQVGMEEIVAKQFLLTGYLEYLIDKRFIQECSETSPRMKIVTSRDARERGNQLSLTFDIPLDVIQKEFQRRGVVCDVRLPSVIRVAPVPLYNSFADVFRFVNILKDALEDPVVSKNISPNSGVENDGRDLE
ncbi:kynureninase-like [Limulus polyphemus]|uniref:Kynureninase n=1 Tax=Limulus polyphemus TaxID=6850 RepID=A0ABM1TNI7_LIMPO|nr:kynureninase-like [Limulus polyphemus]